MVGCSHRVFSPSDSLRKNNKQLKALSPPTPPPRGAGTWAPRRSGDLGRTRHGCGTTRPTALPEPRLLPGQLCAVMVGPWAPESVAREAPKANGRLAGAQCAAWFQAGNTGPAGCRGTGASVSPSRGSAHRDEGPGSALPGFKHTFEVLGSKAGRMSLSECLSIH